MRHNASHVGPFMPHEFEDNGQHTASHYGPSMQHEVEDNEGHNAQHLGPSMQHDMGSSIGHNAPILLHVTNQMSQKMSELNRLLMISVEV